jgi:hypothetical protein
LQQQLIVNTTYDGGGLFGMAAARIVVVKKT